MLNSTALWFYEQWNLEDQGITRDKTSNYKNIELDTSQVFFPNEIWVVRPAWEVTIKVVTLIPIVLLGLLGNSSLAYIIIRTRSLHTTTNLYIANMALADLGAILFCPWMLLSIDLFQNYIFGAIGCHMDGFLTHSLTLVTVFSLSIVSYDRVSVIVLSCEGKLSKRVVCILAGATWVTGLAIAAPLAFVRDYRTRQWVDFFESYCTENHFYLIAYWNIFVGVSVWAPLAIMLVCYSAILIKLDRRKKLVMKSNNPIPVKYRSRVSRILALVVLVFIICRVPFTVLVLQRAQLLQQPAKQQQADAIYELWYVSRYLVILNAAVNPILYGCTSGSLRKALASFSATAWIFRNKKMNGVQKSTFLQNTPNPVEILDPYAFRSQPDYDQSIEQQALPNISSKISALTCNSMYL